MVNTRAGTDQSQSPRRWQRYLALWRRMPWRARGGLIAGVTVAVVAVSYLIWVHSALWALEVDGHVVAVMSSRGSAQAMIDELVRDAARTYGRQVTVYSKIVFRPVTRAQARDLEKALYIQDAGGAFSGPVAGAGGGGTTVQGAAGSGAPGSDLPLGRSFAGTSPTVNMWPLGRSTAGRGGTTSGNAAATVPTNLVDNPNVVRQRLAQALVLGTQAAAIMIGGQPVVYVESVAVGQRVLDKILADYKARYDNGGTQWQDIHFAENPSVQAANAPINQIKGLQDAENILLRGTDELRNYTVQKGDSLWLIASRNHMTVDKLQQANPQLQGEMLQVGQVLNLVVAKPYLTILSTEQKTYTRSVPYPVQVREDPNRWPWEHVVEQKGTPGQEQVTEIIARRNGQVVGQQITQVIRLKDPTVQVELTGTRQVPRLGSGQFVWPLAVPGQITSPFGYRRWRYRSEFHTGVDIATPTGTQVRAADAGMVVFTGRDGNYGYLVKVDHGGGVVTFYAHLSRILVRVGDTVKQGEVIALAGDSGRSTGPHLHFEVRVNGEPVNPFKYYPAGG